MSTIKIEGAIWARKYSWQHEFSFTWSCITDPDHKSSSESIGIYIAPYTIEIEFDGEIETMLHKNALQALQRQRTLILAENQKRIDEIDEQLARMMALENKAEATT